MFNGILLFSTTSLSYFSFHHVLIINLFFHREFSLDFKTYTMRSSTVFFACVLGILPNLSVADPLIFRTLDKPFTLRAADSNQWNVVFYPEEFESPDGGNYNVNSARINRDSSGAVQFRLTNGNLTTADGLTAAFFDGDYLAGLKPLPPLPIYFGDFEARAVHSLVGITPLFAAEAVCTPSGEPKLQLFSFNGGELSRQSFGN